MKKWIKCLCLFLLLSGVAVPTVVEVAAPVTVQAASAGWVKSGTIWKYRNSDGTYSKNKFQVIKGATYYFNSSSVMVTGWKYINSKWYYFTSSGAMCANRWVKSKGIWYYMSGDGTMMTSKWLKKDTTWYYLKSSGAMAVGWVKVGSTWYYMDTTSGAMYANRWHKSADGYWYYLGSSGAMTKNTLVSSKYYVGDNGRMITGWKKISGSWYYFNSDGAMAKSSWKKSGSSWYYLGSSGTMVTNTWVGSSYYVGDNGAMYANCTVTIGEYICIFDANGRCTSKSTAGSTSANGIDPITGKQIQVQQTYYTDPQIGTGSGQVTIEDFLTAAVYCESGDQGDIGMQAVAMVMLNRVNDRASFPNEIRLVIYQGDQFAICRDGSLTRVLKDTALHNRTNKYYEAARASVQKAQAIMNNYTQYGKARTITGFPMPSGLSDFNFLFFMTPAAFTRLCESGSLSQTGVGYFASYNPPNGATGHVFFQKWGK